MNRPLLSANVYAALASLIAGCSVVATRFVVVEVDPIVVAFWRYAIAVACLSPLMLLRTATSFPGWAETTRIALLGFLFFGFFPWAFSASLQFTTAPRGAIGLSTMPIQTLIVGVICGRERLSLNKVTSVGLAFAGILVVFAPALVADAPDSGSLRGDLLMLAAACAGAIHTVFSRAVINRRGVLFVTIWAMVFGALSLMPAAAAKGGLSVFANVSVPTMLSLLFLGVIGGALQFSLFALALRRLTASRTAIYLALNPISAMILAYAILGEPTTPTVFVGLVLVLAGIAFANRPNGNG